MLGFDKPIVTGTFIKRYKRFFADVLLDSGEQVVAHCPNTGTMKSCLIEGAPVILTHNPDPKRKLHYTLELIDGGNGFIGVNTHRPNKIAEKGIIRGLIPELSGYPFLKREQKYGENSKIDILLQGHSKRPDTYIEVKNVTLWTGKELAFPDAVTTRGQKHLEELSGLTQAGKRAVMLYLINRPEGDVFTIAKDIDPAYNALFNSARAAGVEMLAYRVFNTVEGSQLTETVKIL